MSAMLNPIAPSRWHQQPPESITHSLDKLTDEPKPISAHVKYIRQVLSAKVSRPPSLRLLQNHLPLRLGMLFLTGFSFHIDKHLTSSATKVMFNDSDNVKKQICLKMWLECNNGLYNTKDSATRTRYLLEGLQFNRRFAPDIYLGIVPTLSEPRDVIECGRLIKEPENTTLALDKPYALVMKRLNDGWRLDHQLYPDFLGNEQGMEFLAQAIAYMHKHLDLSPQNMGTINRLLSKLHLNRRLFQKALDDPLFRNRDIRWYPYISRLLDQASKVYLPDFEKRNKEGHIRRCHGDLKATNLWVRPINTSNHQSSTPQHQLVPLDCVDFNPEFCHIDTLSDIAMLAIDLEMRLTSWADDPESKLRGAKLAQHFLSTYLQTMGENEDVWPLLEYYMTEKAIVCMYMSILFDSLPRLGEKYLNVVLTHSKNLEKYICIKKPSHRRKITKPLVSTASGTTWNG